MNNQRLLDAMDGFSHSFNVTTRYSEEFDEEEAMREMEAHYDTYRD